MNACVRCMVAALALAASLCRAPAVRAQGSLTPPGPPGLTMKTLEQVEPRIPISTSGRFIDMPGSYYLTCNLWVPAGGEGVAFGTGNVTLDLNGYAIIYVGEGGSTDCDGVAGFGEIVVRNGQILNFPGRGLYLGDACVIEDVIIENCGLEGISVGEQSRVSRCRVSGCGGAAGVLAGGSSLLESVIATGCGVGAHLGVGGQITRSTVSLNTGNGIEAESRCVVSGNTCMQNGNGGTGAGIRVSGSEGRIENNHLALADTGLQITGDYNFVSGNTVRDNTANYVNSGQGNQMNLLISQLPQSLDWPCAVRLSGPLTCVMPGVNGLTVNADDVTIDLGGHALTGPGAGSGHGIFQDSSRRNLRVFNGKVVKWQGLSTVSGWYPSGIAALGRSANISDVQAFTNNYGISFGGGANVRGCGSANNISYGYYALSAGAQIFGCTARANGGYGFELTYGTVIAQCDASYNAGVGIRGGYGGTVTGSTAFRNTGNGIEVGYGSVVSDCASTDNGADGFAVYAGSVIRNAVAVNNAGDGIQISSNCTVLESVCKDNGYQAADGAGIYAFGGNNRIEGNSASGNDRGLDIDDTGNLVIRNNATGNTVNYDISANNKVGVIVVPSNSGAILGNSGGGLGTADPNANFAY